MDSSSQDAERDKIFASDKDPMEELAELRREEALKAPPEEPAEELTAVEEEVAAQQEEESHEVGDDDLEAFKPEEEEEKAPEPGGEVKAEEEEVPEEESDEDAVEEKEEEPSTIYKFKADGQDFEFTQEEINDQFGAVFAKAMNYTRKMQKLSPYKKMVSALEEENISEKDLNLAIDIMKGDKAALQKLIAEKEIDVYDLGTEGETQEYEAKDYGKTEHQQQLADIDRELSADPEYAQTVDIIGNQWDESSRQALSDNPEWITGLHSDVKSGVFSKVAPEATKMKMLDGGSKPDIEYYLLAGQQLKEREEKLSTPIEDPAKVAAQQFKEDTASANKKRSASSTRSRAGTKGVVDYLEDNDEKFDSWYEDIMSKS